MPLPLCSQPTWSYSPKELRSKRFRGVGEQRKRGAFHLFGKTGRSGGKRGIPLKVFLFFRKMSSGKARSIWFPTGTTGFSKQMESAPRNGIFGVFPARNCCRTIFRAGKTPKIPFLRLSLLPSPTEMLATQATKEMIYDGALSSGESTPNKPLERMLVRKDAVHFSVFKAAANLCTSQGCSKNFIPT